jgi:CDP-2,3-bis-(O-geranylgeranyl)-sn-glycerol synthase
VIGSAAGALAGRVVQLVYFMLPAYAANMAPPFLGHWKGWNPPIAPRWLGTHKTVLGFAAGVVAAVIVTAAQSRIAWGGALTAYDSPLALGVRFGAGAMAGDSLKSFVKRRMGIAPGHAWIPFDQIDFVIGALVLTASRASLSLPDMALIVILSAAGHIAVNHLAYWLGVRKTRW